MQPITSRIATGSLMPDSPSSVRASRRRVRSAARVEVQQQPGRDGGHGGGGERPHGGQRDRGLQHGPDLGEAARQPALEQDQRECHDARLARQLEVAEVDPVEPVGADQHPEAEHQHEARHAQAARRQRGDEARRQQEAGDQQELPLVQGPHPARLPAL